MLAHLCRNMLSKCDKFAINKELIHIKYDIGTLWRTSWYTFHWLIITCNKFDLITKATKLVRYISTNTKLHITIILISFFITSVCFFISFSIIHYQCLNSNLVIDYASRFSISVRISLLNETKVLDIRFSYWKYISSICCVMASRLMWGPYVVVQICSRVSGNPLADGSVDSSSECSALFICALP